ncbi:ribonucleotide reductase R1 subunit [Vibrio phage 2.275.O._10N.286.54.E11]|nr:ribonucleotide reductase R1 subunit [Vibrio phage 2.275.O._10N.286.54.E11]
MIKNVIKRNGETVPFDAEKLNRWAEYATKMKVNWSEIVFNTVEKLHDNVTTLQIHQAMIDACTDKKKEEYLNVAARLLRGDLYKNVYGSEVPDAFSTTYAKLVRDGFWEDFNLTADELEILDATVDYTQDKTYEYASLCQFIDKYAISKYINGKKMPVETPQVALMGIALALFKNDSMTHVVNFYNIIKKRTINIATPIMAAARTGENGFASCFVTTSGDTLDSIMAGNNLAYRMTANRAGIGFEHDIRSVGDIVGNDKCKHAGKIPHYKMLVETIKSVTQGVRGGAATVSFNCLDPEIEDLLRLKHPTTPLAKRVELMDYSLVFNEEFRKRVAKNEDWLLVSKVQAPDLHQAFYENRDKFPELLASYLAPHSGRIASFLTEGTPKKAIGTVVKARDIAALYLTQRQDTGRVYSFNVDHSNDHTPFKETIRLSNLCHEIHLPTRPYSSPVALDKQHGFGNDGLVGLCFLLALDVGKIISDDEYKQAAYYAARALDNIITNMFYPYETLREVGEKYRSIGVGITNLAYHMAKEDLLYSEEEGRNEIHWIAERHAYMMYQASNSLAEERGVFEWYNETKYADGYLIIDSYNKEVDNHHSAKVVYDWEGLRTQVAKHGLRFSTHTAHMPTESSAVWGYSANGVYPIRSGMVLKQRPEGIVPFLPPEYEKLQYAYQFAWDVSTKDLAKCYAILQKYCDQGISADEYIDFNQRKDGKSSMKEMMQDWMFWYKLGLKTIYYKNTKTETTDDSISGDDDGCSSCKL